VHTWRRIYFPISCEATAHLWHLWFLCAAYKCTYLLTYLLTWVFFLAIVMSQNCSDPKTTAIVDVGEKFAPTVLHALYLLQVNTGGGKRIVFIRIAFLLGYIECMRCCLLLPMFAVSVCLSRGRSRLRCAKMAKQINMLFGVNTPGGSWYMTWVLMPPQREEGKSTFNSRTL